jgi:hypothetical protein
VAARTETGTRSRVKLPPSRCCETTRRASPPARDGAIVGFRRSEQVDPIVDAASLELTDDDIAEIEGGN